MRQKLFGPVFGLLLIAGLSAGWASFAWAQPDESTTGETSRPAEPSDDGQEEASQPSEEEAEPKPVGRMKSTMRDVEQWVDGVAGWCAKRLASVLFYEIVGRKEYSTELDGAVTDLESIRKLVEQVTEEGLDTKEVNFTLTLPPGSLSEEQVEDLQAACNREFTTGRARSFSVKVAEQKQGEPVSQVSKFQAVIPGIPIVVLWLGFGAVFFTLRMGFINFRGFKHAVLVTAGKYDNPKDTGEVSHFQALTAALSATVGLGNIAGVAIAVATGGPGAVFWMIIAGLLGMTAKFTECTLGQKYREVRPDGRIMGGAMFYLSNGLKEMKLGGLGKFLAVLFAVLCVLASLGGGNAFQVNQSGDAVLAQLQQNDSDRLKNLSEQIAKADTDGDQKQVESLNKEREELQSDISSFATGFKWIYGIILAVLVAVVIIGGIRRIAATAEKIVPLMCGMYVLACLWILLINMSQLDDAIGTIVREAFTPQAGYGALIGVLVMGFRRAAFSNEAGVGSAAIAHAAARTDYPVREGIVALLEPFIDTVVVCTMTGLVIVITGAYNNPDYAQFVANNQGAGLTSRAMQEQIWWFPYILSVAVILFAYSTMISWSYYGERCWAYLFGDRASMVYRVIFVFFVVLGSIMSATNVLDLSDLMILGMAFPNILGVLLLSGKVKRDLDDYWRRLKAGELERTK